MGAEQQVVYGVTEGQAKRPGQSTDTSAPLQFTTERLRTWGLKSALARVDWGLFSGTGLWSIVDQGAVSAGNFLTAILLARYLPQSDYGIYALIFAMMLLMIFLHGAIVALGLSLHGAVGNEVTLRPLVGASLALTGGLGVFLGAATGGLAVVLHRASLYPWILLAVLFWQFQETTRRALMSQLKHRAAIWGDAVSYLGQASCIACLFTMRRLTLASTFEVMAVTSAAGCLLQAAQLRLKPQDFRGALRLLPKFWLVARWPLLATVAQATIGQSLLWFLALAGTAKVASFQSLLSVLRITNPVMFAMGSVLIPTVAAGQRKSSAGLSAAWRYGFFGALILLPYFAAILISPGLVLRILYGAGSPYAALGVELRVLVLGSVLVYAEHILGMYYYGLSRGDVALRCELVAAAVAVLAGFSLVRRAGVLGAAIAYDLTFAVGTAAFLWFLYSGKHKVRNRSKVVRAGTVENVSAAEN